MLTINKSNRWRTCWIGLIILIIVPTFFKEQDTVFAGESVIPPVTSNAFFQTNGPNGYLRWGDWWTNSDPDAGNQPHMFELYVPCLVDSDFGIEVQLYDPENYQTGTEIDELEGSSWDDATFQLIAPDEVTEVVQQTFPPVAGTSEKWNAFASFTVRNFGCGIYRLYVSTSDDDQNAYRIKIVEADPDGVPDSGDEINIVPVETAFQHDGGGCATFWFYVADKPVLRLSNFDMDGEISVDYTDANGTPYTGTVSGGTVWNNGGDVPFPPPGGDAFSNPTPGWWSAEICIGDANQYVFYPEGGIFIDYQPNAPTVSVSKDDGVTQSYEDEDLTYTIIVTNSGDGPALDVTMSDTLPSGTSYINATGNVTYQFQDPYEILTWDVGLILAGESDTVYLDVHVSEGAQSPIINWAHVSHSDVFFNEYNGINDSDQDNIIATGSIGDFIWQDDNGDGNQDVGESGLEDVILYLVDASSDTVARDTTDADGSYLFAKVIAGDYTVYVDESTLPVGAILTTANVPYIITLVEGQDDAAADFGYQVSFIPVELALFTAMAEPGAITLSWATYSETENLGFNILRRDSKEIEYRPINSELIKGSGFSDEQHFYTYRDEDVTEGVSYSYLLEDVAFNGERATHGPVKVIAVGAPAQYVLEQNHPNPFNPETRINFILKETGYVTLTIFNLRGQVVRTLVSEQLSAGAHSAVWKGRDDGGNILPSGTYLYKLQANGFEQTRKMVFAK